MAILLFPGRHLVMTKFQEEYCADLLSRNVSELVLEGTFGGQVDEKIDHLVFAITSANQSGSRYNPVPLHARITAIDRFVARLRERHSFHISYVMVPHFPPSDRFAGLLLKHVADQVGTPCSPAETVILSSTPTLIADYRVLGYAVAPAEYSIAENRYHEEAPIEIIRALASADGDYRNSPAYQKLSRSTISVWEDMPEIPIHVFRIWNDPLLTEEGSLTHERNYSTYAYGMGHDALITQKANDVIPAILPGKIVDEGCADCALIGRLAAAFPDSDIIGIDITGEFIARCTERQRVGEFSQTFVSIYQRNLLSPIFKPESVTTTLCNSTLHEIYSYGNGEKSVREYLALKYAQLSKGGRLVIRDVVGPLQKETVVWLRLSETDGSNEEPLKQVQAEELPNYLSGLSTFARFIRFAEDFLAERRRDGLRKPVNKINYEIVSKDDVPYIKCTLKDAMEFLLTKDYTDNWQSEMHEEFTFWDFDQWQDALVHAGFTIVNDTASPARFSRAYVNQWILDHRILPCAALFTNVDGTLVPYPFPSMNMVLVGEK